MSYPKEILDAGHITLNKRRESARTALVARRAKIEADLPQVLELERSLTGTSAQIAKAILGGGDTKTILENLKSYSLECQRLMADELISAGYTKDYLEIKYTCPKCNDTGYTADGMCICFKRILKELMYYRLGSSGALSVCDFDSFRLDYYPSSAVNGSDIIPFKVMRDVFDSCIKYAKEFKPGAPNLLMAGPTGLGKTHLSLAIAGTVLEHDYDVIYIPFHLLLTQLEGSRFGKGSADYANYIEPILNCELLILDDLGSEFLTTFTVSTLYDIVNTRISSGSSMIINTNLEMKELEQRYSPRLVSRLVGNFKTLPFRGNDIRFLKRFGKQQG